MDCKRGFTNVYEITQHVADNTKLCESCENLTYSSGMLTCKLLLNEIEKAVSKEKPLKRY